jgi:hypothetical protein
LECIEVNFTSIADVKELEGFDEETLLRLACRALLAELLLEVFLEPMFVW